MDACVLVSLGGLACTSRSAEGDDPEGTSGHSSSSSLAATQASSTADADTSGGVESTTSTTSSSDASTTGGLACPLNPAWAPPVTFLSPTMPSRPLVGISFTSGGPCTVEEASASTVSLICPDAHDAAVVHEIALTVSDFDDLNLGSLPRAVTLAYFDGKHFEGCGDAVLRLADATTDELLLVVAETLPHDLVAPLEVERIDTECTAYVPAQQLGNADCRAGALRFTSPDGETVIPEAQSGSLPGGALVEVIRAHDCLTAGSRACSTIHFTIVHEILLAGG